MPLNKPNEELRYTQTNNDIILWDNEATPSKYTQLLYTWTGYFENGSIHSLLRYIENHDEHLRSKYLAWIHNLGESRINGKRLIEHLVLDDKFSYWWMTLFVEKSPWKSPSMIDVLRLFAIEEIILQEKPSRIRLISANRNLHRVIRELCKNLEIAYEWERLPNKSLSRLNIKKFYKALPQAARALITLTRYLTARWPLRHAKKLGWFSDERSLFFCSYFFNIDPKSAKEGHFHSRYWEGLHSLLKKLGISGNWLQLYYPHDAVPSSQVAIDWTERFNSRRKQEGFHTFLDAYLSWRIVLRVLKYWIKLIVISFRLTRIKNIFHPQGSHFSLWPIIKRDWQESISGTVAITNLLWIELFDIALQSIPHQTKGLYLSENQAWERAFIHTWQKHGHGELIAVPHATIRFWDLRYFNDSRTTFSSDPYPMPQADRIAVNGKMASEGYLRANYPKEVIVECEALRYEYLNDLRIKKRSKKTEEQTVKILILGDFISSTTVQMLKLLEAATLDMPDHFVYTIKPHPNFPVRREDYPSLNLKVVMDPLVNLLPDFDIAYSSNTTSASVDAYLAGLSVVVMLDEIGLNLSPLRGESEVRFVSTPAELAKAILTPDADEANNNRNRFFFLDPKLPRWQSLLSSVNQLEQTKKTPKPLSKGVTQ